MNKFLLRSLIIFSMMLFVIGIYSKDKDKDKDKIEFSIEEFENTEKKEFSFNLFYPVHYLYLHILDSFNLRNKLSFDQRKDLIEKLTKIISKNNSARLTFFKFLGNEDLIFIIKMEKVPTDKLVYDEIFIISNYDFKKKKIVYGDDLKDAYATFFIIKNDMIINYHYMYSKERDEEIKKQNIPNNLADYYIYDDNPANDDEAEKILEDEIENTKDINNKFVCIMTLSEYYMIKGDIIMAGKLISNGKSLLKNIDKEHKENYLIFHEISTDILNIYKQLNNITK